LVRNWEDVDSISLTTDTWTSNANKIYITVTEHHIDKTWNMNSNVLVTREMPERHTADNLADKLKSIVSEFHLCGKITDVVHDNARNMVSAGNKCPDWDDAGCFAHTLQLCIKPALELPSVSKLISRARKLVGHFKHSTTVTAEMRKRQKLFELPQHELIQDVVIRWNSTQLMMERLCEQRSVISDSMLDPSLTKKEDMYMLLKENEWETMAEISKVLQQLTKVTTYMNTESNVSTSVVYPIVCGLIRKHLSVNADDIPVVIRIKTVIADDLHKRFKPGEVATAATVPVLSSCLDPRYKHLNIWSSEQRQLAIETLESTLEGLPLTMLKRRFRENESSPKKAKVQRVLDFLLEDDSEDNAESEITAFMRERVDPDTDYLAWWKDNSDKYSRLSVLARRYLGVPSTSVPSERIFSAAGWIVTKLRNRLSSSCIDQIIFLNKNSVPQ
jgi:hypothetical protein